MVEGICGTCGTAVLTDEESGAVAHLNSSVQCAVADEMTALVNLWEGNHPAVATRAR